jgi:hypothetical protein
VQILIRLLTCGSAGAELLLADDFAAFVHFGEVGENAPET